MKFREGRTFGRYPHHKLRSDLAHVSMSWLKKGARSKRPEVREDQGSHSSGAILHLVPEGSRARGLSYLL